MDKTLHIVAYANQFQEMFLSKDIFLIPYYISKELGGSCEYIYTHNFGNTLLPAEHRGVRLTQTKSKNEWAVILKHIIRRARQIDVLFLTGSSARHMLTVWLYKKLNPKGRVVVFGDMEAPQAKELNACEFHYSGGVVGKIKDALTNFFFHNVTYLVANTEAYGYMAQLCNRKKWPSLLHFYPCLDDEKFEASGLQRIPFAEKENIIICVGRIGCHQKNTEMLLGALAEVDLKDWTLYLIGPIAAGFDLKEQTNFQSTIDEFFRKHPKHKGKLVFTGPIYDFHELYTYYQRAKVLLSTARHEGFANVYSQAAALGCYVISTDVGGADVCSNDWAFGTKLQQEDAAGLSRVLEDLVEGHLVMDEHQAIPYEQMAYSYRVNNVLLPKMGFVPLAATYNVCK